MSEGRGSWGQKVNWTVYVVQPKVWRTGNERQDEGNDMLGQNKKTSDGRGGQTNQS